jgi:hypothetical protein
VYPDTEFDPLVLRDRRILVGHTALYFYSTAYSIDGTGKLDQHSVARGLDDPPAMLGNGGVNEGLPDRLEPTQRAFLVCTHQAAVSGDISRQHRRQPSFHPLSGQKMPLKLAIRPNQSKHVGLLSG